MVNRQRSKKMLQMQMMISNSDLRKAKMCLQKWERPWNEGLKQISAIMKETQDMWSKPAGFTEIFALTHSYRREQEALTADPLQMPDTGF